MGAIAALIGQLITLVPSLVSAGIAVKDLLSKARDVLDENKVPGDPEWEQLEAAITQLQNAPGGLRDTSQDV